MSLCQKQLNIFADLFTPEVLELAKMGMRTKNWGIKLCGSGGGGFYFLFTRDHQIPDEVKASGLISSPLLD